MNMSLAEFFAQDGIFVTAFSPLQKILSLPFTAEETQPRGLKWTRIAGKGGQHYPEYRDISLYRHCQEVALFASVLFYYAARTQKLARFDLNTPAAWLPVLQDLIAIAFAHDADKYCEAGKSSSPNEQMVRQVYHDLQMDTWTRWTPERLFTAVNFVEKRGHAAALLFGTDLSDLDFTLAKMVARADGLISVTAKGDMNAFIRKYNHAQDELHTEFGVPKKDAQFIQIRETPALLHFLKTALYEICINEYDFCPFILTVQGGTLYAILPDHFDWEQALTSLQAILNEGAKPLLVRAAQTGDMTLRHIYDKTDLDSLIETDPMKGLTVHNQDWENIRTLLMTWGEQQNGILINRIPKGQIFFVFEKSKKEQASAAYYQVLKLVIALRGRLDGFAAEPSFEQKCQALLALHDHWITHYLTKNEITFQQLKADSKQTLLAILVQMHLIQTGLYSEDAIFNAIYATGYPERPEAATGIIAVINALRTQVGLLNAEETPHDQPYGGQAVSNKSGHCLICGTHTTKKLDGRTFPVSGYIKSSAFANRIGYRKDLYRSTGENYICESCVTKQTLMLNLANQVEARLAEVPLTITTPVRQVLYHLHSENRLQNITLRQFSKEEGLWHVLPWQTDFVELIPFLFESRPRDMLETVDRLLYAARYALWSGEPVHLFVSAQHDVHAAWYSELIPEIIRPLIFDNGRQLLHPERTYPLITDAAGGLRRDQLPMLIQRLMLIHYVLRNPMTDKYTVLQAMPHFGWWPVAWLFFKSEDHSKTSGAHLKLAQEIFSMDFDSRLKQLAETGLKLQGYGRNYDSNSEVTFAFDRVLEAYDQYQRILFKRPEPTIQPGEEGLTNYAAHEVQQYLERRYDHIHGQTCRHFVEDAIRLILEFTQQGEFDPQSRRFIRSAYAGFFNQLRYTKRTPQTTAPAATATDLEDNIETL